MKTISLKKSAFISVDNTKTFEDKSLNELYVPEWEQAAIASKKVAEACKRYGILTINVLEEHPLWHISLAANYKDKKAFDSIAYDEVKTWTEENNGIGKRAEFTLSELKRFLSEVWSQMLRPDHSIENTSWIELAEPLQESDFDIKIVKGTNPAKEAYSGFDETNLDHILKKRNIKKVFIGGVATDYCIGKTALDAKDLHYDVYIVSDAVRGVSQASTKEMVDLLTTEGVKFIHTKEFNKHIQQSFHHEK